MTVQFMVSCSSTNWVKTNAKSLAGAKRAAMRNCAFAGQTLWIGVMSEEGFIIEVAVRRCDPITQKHKVWTDL